MKVLISKILFLFIILLVFSCKNSTSKSNSSNDSALNNDNQTRTQDDTLKPILKIGKSIDYENQSIIGTSTFSIKNKKFSYFLFNHKKFGISHLTLRFYKILDNGKRQLDSVNIDIDPEANVVSDSLEFAVLYNQYGKGNFLMQFLIGDKVLAETTFTVI